MRILFLGDIVGRSGRDGVATHLPDLRRKLGLDFVIVNGENAAHGFGITGQIAQGLYQCGVDAITTGNHIWDQREIVPHIAGDPKLLRPVNFPKGTPGQGMGVYTLADGRKVVVVNVMCRLFMDPLDDPFTGVDEAIARHPLAGVSQAIVIDVHGEATSEKMALGYYFDGRASLVVGTHSHVPTADARILPKGTAYQTDAGMCGDYDSIIGMKKEVPIARFTKKMPTERLTPAEGEATICGVYVETDNRSGLARRIEPLRLGGILVNTVPTAPV
jgi:2',3'-cyclic-nucleotide 2'-phosphodiesterase